MLIHFGGTLVSLGRVAEVGALAETAKYPSALARSACLQIFATKNTVFYNCEFLQQKRGFSYNCKRWQPCASVDSNAPELAL